MFPLYYTFKKVIIKYHNLRPKKKTLEGVIVLISQIHPISPKVILLTGDAIETGRRCLFGLSVYIFVTYEGLSVLRTYGHRQQT